LTFIHASNALMIGSHTMSDDLITGFSKNDFEEKTPEPKTTSNTSTDPLSPENMIGDSKAFFKDTANDIGTAYSKSKSKALIWLAILGVVFYITSISLALFGPRVKGHLIYTNPQYLEWVDGSTSIITWVARAVAIVIFTGLLAMIFVIFSKGERKEVVGHVLGAHVALLTSIFAVAAVVSVFLPGGWFTNNSSTDVEKWILTNYNVTSTEYGTTRRESSVITEGTVRSGKLKVYVDGNENISERHFVEHEDNRYYFETVNN
jgi:hypothetical protein